MAEVAADATVLIFLAKLDRLDLLEDHYDRVLIPSIVYDEVVTAGRRIGAPDAAVVDESVSAGWLDVVTVDGRDEVARFDLEAGEAAVLSIAVNRSHDLVLADEESVRQVARYLDIRPRGTLYFLLSEVRDGDRSFDDFVGVLERLLNEGFYLDEAVYLEAIRAARRLES